MVNCLSILAVSQCSQHRGHWYPSGSAPASISQHKVDEPRFTLGGYLIFFSGESPQRTSSYKAAIKEFSPGSTGEVMLRFFNCSVLNRALALTMEFFYD